MSRQGATARRGLSRSWPLATTLTLSFGSLTVATAGIVLAVSISSGLQTARDLLVGQAVQLVGSVTGRIRSHLRAASNQAAYMSQRLVEDGLLEPGREADLIAALRNSVAAAPQIAGTMFVSPSLRAYDVDRTESGVKHTISDWGDSDQARAGLGPLRRAQEGFWAETVYVATLSEAVMNFRMPVRIGGDFAGALITTITTSDLDRFVTKVASPHDATAFILIGASDVLAYSNADRRQLPASEDRPLPALASIGDAVLENLWNEAASEHLGESERFPGYEVRRVTVDGERYLVVNEYLQGVGPSPWLIGCYFRAEDMADAFDRLAGALALGLAMLGLALVAVFVVGKHLSRPILNLASAAVRVGRAGPGQAPLLPPSRLREIALAADGFNEMVDGLREREQLRKTFGKYVPIAVADAIVDQGGTLVPQSRLTTTLFTDIVGFSTVAEDMAPESLIAMLNEYFSAMVDPIEHNGGVIHQFQGDAILATFNLPVPHADHARRAVQAALDIQALGREARFLGRTLPTRIGINTGMAVCGTVGSAGRLGFTVHGDEVNLAARIEQINKSLGTRILVAQSTVALAGPGFDFERVGEVPVRGRQRPVVLYRVTGPHNADETWSGQPPPS